MDKQTLIIFSLYCKVKRFCAQLSSERKDTNVGSVHKTDWLLIPLFICPVILVSYKRRILFLLHFYLHWIILNE